MILIYLILYENSHVYLAKKINILHILKRNIDANMPVAFRNVVCDTQGYDSDNSTFKLCSTCVNDAFKKKVTPKYALVEGLFCGDIPNDLPTLTFIEEMLLCLVRVYIMQ